MIDKLKKLIEQRNKVDKELSKLISDLDFDSLSFTELELYFDTVYPVFQGYAIYPPRDFDSLIGYKMLTWHDDFYLERHENMEYSNLIDTISEWEEDDYNKRKCDLLKVWAETDNLEEAKQKVIAFIMKIALKQQQAGFEYDW